MPKYRKAHTTTYAIAETTAADSEPEEHYGTTLDESNTDGLADFLHLDGDDDILPAEHMRERISEREKRIQGARRASRAWAQDMLQELYENYVAGQIGKGEMNYGLLWYLKYVTANKFIGPLPHDPSAIFDLTTDSRIPDEAHDVVTDAWLNLHVKIDDYQSRMKEGKKTLLASWINVCLTNQQRMNERTERRRSHRLVSIVDSASELGTGAITSDRLTMSLADGPDVFPDEMPEDTVSRRAWYQGDHHFMFFLKDSLEDIFRSGDKELAAIMWAIIHAKDIHTESDRINIAKLTRMLNAGDFAQIDPSQPFTFSSSLSEDTVGRRVAAIKKQLVTYVRQFLIEEEQKKMNWMTEHGHNYVPLDLDNPEIFKRERRKLFGYTKTTSEVKPHLPTEPKLTDADYLELNGRWGARIVTNDYDYADDTDD